MSTNVEGIGPRLREIRLAKDFSQSKMATRLGIADRSYKLYELEKREIPLSVAVRFCREFSLELKWLATGVGPKYSEGEGGAYQQAAEATLTALQEARINVPPKTVAKQIQYVFEQSNVKGTSAIVEAQALVEIINVEEKNDST